MQQSPLGFSALSGQGGANSLDRRKCHTCESERRTLWEVSSQLQESVMGCAHESAMGCVSDDLWNNAGAKITYMVHPGLAGSDRSQSGRPAFRLWDVVTRWIVPLFREACPPFIVHCQHKGNGAADVGKSCDFSVRLHQLS